LEQFSVLSTVRSFVEIVRYLLNHREAKGRYSLSEKFSQDPLENYFGKQQMKGSRNEGRQE